jgi:hypothetical protein
MNITDSSKVYESYCKYKNTKTEFEFQDEVQISSKWLKWIELHCPIGEHKGNIYFM